MNLASSKWSAQSAMRCYGQPSAMLDDLLGSWAVLWLFPPIMHACSLRRDPRGGRCTISTWDRSRRIFSP
jgi:hypothetical protein